MQRTDRVGATSDEILMRRLDIGIGTFFGNVTFFFITLTTALTLHRHGITHRETTVEVASALRPIAGPFASGRATRGRPGERSCRPAYLRSIRPEQR